LTQICTKLFVGWGFVPDPTGELTALPRPPGWIKGSLLLRKRRGRRAAEMEGREGRGAVAFKPQGPEGP